MNPMTILTATALVSILTLATDSRPGLPGHAPATTVRKWEMSGYLIPSEWLAHKAILSPEENTQAMALDLTLGLPEGDDVALTDDARIGLCKEAVSRIHPDIWPGAARKFLEAVRTRTDADAVLWLSRFVVDGVYTSIRGEKRGDELTALRVLVAYPRDQEPPARLGALERELAAQALAPAIIVEFGQEEENGKSVFYRGRAYTLQGSAPTTRPYKRPHAGPTTAPASQPGLP